MGGNKERKTNTCSMSLVLLSGALFLFGTERHCSAAEVMAICSPVKFKVSFFLLFFVLHTEKESFREIPAWAEHFLCSNGINCGGR